MIFKLLRYSTLLATTLFFTACFKDPAPSQTLNQIPAWYINPVANSEAYIYGTGEGKTFQEAKNAALNDMAARLSVTLDSSITHYKQSTSYNESNNYQKKTTQNITVEVKAITFNNATIEASKTVGRSYFIALKVNRQALFNQHKHDFDMTENSLNLKLKNSENLPLLERIYALESLLLVFEKARAQAIILNAINPQFDAKGYVLKYEAQINRLHTLKEQIKIKISTNLSQKLFAQEFINVLTQEGYKVSSSSPHVEIGLNSTVNYSVALGWHIAKVLTTISVISEGKIVSNQTLQSIGRSSSSQENALVNAAQFFKQEVLKKGVNTLLFHQ